MIDSDRIAAIEARCEAATPGPWSVKIHNEEYGQGYGAITYFVEIEGELLKIGLADNNRLLVKYRSDTDFIAHAREDILWLLAEVKRLREAPRWIPVEERLPEVGKCVLIRQTYHAILGEHGEYEGITVGYLHQPTDRRGKPYFYWAAVSDYGDMVRAESICPGNEFVTHWMPLPAAPEEGDSRETMVRKAD